MPKLLSPIRQLKKKLDRLCREYVHLRWDYCVTCGKREDLQWAHVLSAANHNTKWDVANFTVQCAGCNLRHEHDPYPLFRWYINTYGQEALDELHKRWDAGASHFTLAQLRDMISEWETIIWKLKGENS